MKVKTKNNRSLVAILAVLLLAFVGTTIAYHTSHGDFTNIFRTIFDQWTVTEEFVSPTNWKQCDRTPKTITATNSGNSSVGVRVKYEEYWKRAGSTSTTHDTELPLQIDGQNTVLVNLNTSHDWELRDDGYYYYTRPLEPYSTTSTFIDYVEYNCDANMIFENDECETINGQTVCTKENRDYSNAQYHLNVTVELTDEPETYNISTPNKATIYSSSWLNFRMKEIANPNATFNYTSDPDTKIRAIKMADSLPAGGLEENWGTTTFNAYNDEPRIFGWFEESTGTFYFYTEADYIEAYFDMNYTFQGFEALTDISGLANWRTHDVSTMTALFSGCSSLTNVDALSKWDTSNVLRLGSTFYNATSLTNVNGLINWHTGKVTNMQSTFSGNTSLNNIDGLSGWDVSNVTTMGWLFYNDSNIQNLTGLRHWNTGNVTAINSAFNGLTGLTDISGLANWDTHNVTNMGYLMHSVAAASLSALADWKTGNVQFLDNAFAKMTNLKNLDGLKNWDTHSVTTLHSTFAEDSSLENINGLADWNTGNVVDIQWLFGESHSQITTLAPLMNWDVRKVEQADCAFYNMGGHFTSLDGLQNWQTDSLVDTSFMFSRNGGNLRDISQIANWNVSHITNISSMFYGDDNVNGSSLNGWVLPSGANTDAAFTSSDKPSWYQG